MTSEIAADPASVSTSRARARGFDYPSPAELRYSLATPFPHVVLRDAWKVELLDACKSEIGSFADWDGEKDFYGSKKKRYCGDIERLPPSVQRLIHEASSPAFLRWLTELTGEQALLPDPFLEGGGIHQIVAGGFLKVHADFNWNEQMHLFRRLNVLIYLNKDWNPAWGGALELWEQDMSRLAFSIAPEFNTMVVFTTDDKSFHGHPQPLVCPAGLTRDSIALYYYSPIEPAKNFKGRRLDTDYRPVGGEDFGLYDASLSGRIRNRLRKIFAG